MKNIAARARGLARLLFSCTSLTLGLLALPPTVQAAEPSISYTVQPKDELIKMGEASFRSPEDWKEVAKLNRLKSADAIQPGQVLTIPLRLLKMRARDGVLLTTSGEVTLSGKPAQVGDLVPEGAQLQTGANGSAQVLLADGSRVTLMPNTHTILVTSQSVDPGSFDDKVSSNWFTGLLRLTKGAIDVLAAKLVKRTTPLKIETPSSVVGVRGTEFRVAFDDTATQNARTEVLTGLVRADSSAQAIGADLPKGTGTVISPSIERVKVSALLKAPKLASDVTVVKPDLRWPMPALAGAEHFKVQVSGFKDFSTIVREQTVSKQGQADFSGLPNGVWQLRVRGIDADTLEGFNADTRLHVMLPGNPGQAPVQWTARHAQLDVVNGQHVLRFDPQGLEPSHALLATVKINRAPYLRVAKTLVKPDGGPIHFNLGPLQAGESYLLNVTVTQADGATLSPSNYRFEGLPAGGHAEAPLQPVASEEAAHTAQENKPGKSSGHKRNPKPLRP